MSKYPLTESLGVPVHSPTSVAVVVADYVLAADLERALAAAKDVWMCDDGMTQTIHYAEPADAIAVGKVVCHRKIVRDTAESLLRELAANADQTLTSAHILKVALDVGARARKLLGEKGE